MIKLLDVALIALGGMLLLCGIFVCAGMQRPITNAIKWWVLAILFLFLLALSGCATTSMSTRPKAEQVQWLIQGHVSDIAQKIQASQKSESRPSQKSERSPPIADPITLTRAEWLIVRQGQLRRQAIIKALRLEVAACKKANAIQVQRERKKREQAQEQYKRAIAAEQRRVILPWVIVGVTATAAFVGFALYIGKIAP